MGYRITNRDTGHWFIAEPGESVLTAALRNGYTFPYSCRNGACASCKGLVLEGAVSYPEGPPPALGPEDAAAGQALFCQAVPETDLCVSVREVEAVRDIPVRRLPARVSSREKLAPDVIRLDLKLPAGKRMQFLAGQYVDILLGEGRRRAFSIANPPQDDAHLELHVRHVEGGDFTEYVFHDLQERALLRLEGPLGTFFIREASERPMIMMGGGTGFAPLKAMVEYLAHVGETRPIDFYWGAADEQGLYMRELPEAWARDRAELSFTPVLSEPSSDWSGRRGLVHEAVLEDHANLAEYDVYMSGPPAMINVARRDFLKRGLPVEQLYYDSFDFSPDTRLKILKKKREE
ncbi:MAG: CDP-6-deoxy-delta-3,4-glucoseen reductase [Gammaproteobacteria bacterium]|nr:MAG: CDP-6-deoxy-delta-3,4-glucoseen reductase [Gammaproteobacteria bacterium]